MGCFLKCAANSIEAIRRLELGIESQQIHGTLLQAFGLKAVHLLLYFEAEGIQT